LLLAPSAVAANRIELTGVTGERRDNINLYLASFAPAQINKSARFKNRVARQIRQALRGLGYYQVLIDFEDKTDGDDYVLLAKITAGKYVFIDLLDLQMHGDAVRDDEFIRLQRSMAPRKGERMHHGKYEAYKKALLNLAHRKGYFDATFRRAELQVTPGKRQGKLYLYFDSGVRYRFGEIRFEGSQIRHARLQTLVPFNSGDPYSTEQLAKLNQKLAATAWFAGIDLDVDPQARQHGQIPVDVRLTPAVRNTVETGVGFATDVGARLKLNWDKPWLNNRGHSLTTALAVSNPEQSLEVGYKFPLRDAANDYYQLSFGYQHKDLVDTRSTSYNLKGERRWIFGDDWRPGMSIRWLYEDYYQGIQQDKSNLLLPGLLISRNKDSGGSMPRQASALLLTAEFANKSWGSDTDFIWLYGRAGRIGSLSDNSRWLVKLEAGAILQESVSSIPPSLRFFAGGDNSIRGYGYQTISPLDETGQLTGASRLATASAEYQYRVKGDWWLAAFTDYGSAWNDSADFKRSLGLGVRWASPVGPVRLDFAYGLDRDPQGKFRLHFTLGPEL
jgi:translocation and assembly module TamA